MKSAVIAEWAFLITFWTLAGFVTPDIVNWITEFAGNDEDAPEDKKTTVRTLNKNFSGCANAPAGDINATLQPTQEGFPDSVITNFDDEGSAEAG